MYQFEKLNVWTEALDFIEESYTLVKKFPESERYSLTDQIKRASVSVALNIAEGRAKSSDKEFCHYLNISLGSLFEVIAGFKIAVRLKYIDENELDTLFEISNKLGAKLKGLQNKLRNQ